MMRMLLIVLLVLLGGCAGVYRYDTQGATAYGSKSDDGPLYFMLSVDLERDAAQLTRLAIRFADKDPIALDQLTSAEVARQLPPWEPPRQWPDIVKQREIERIKDYEVYAGDGAYLLFKDGILTYLSLCARCQGQRFYPPEIGLAERGTTYPLPLSEPQLREVLGDPKRIGRQREIYY